MFFIYNPARVHQPHLLFLSLLSYHLFEQRRQQFHDPELEEVLAAIVRRQLYEGLSCKHHMKLFLSRPDVLKEQVTKVFSLQKVFPVLPAPSLPYFAEETLPRNEIGR